jgi:hypothetical protein
MDRTWLRNLASSKYQNGAWFNPDPNQPGFVAHARLIEATEALYAIMQDAVEVYNLYADRHRQLKIFKLSRGRDIPAYGLALLVNQLQVNVEERSGHFQLTATLINGPKPPTKMLHQFTPRYDEFGGVFWLMDDRTPVTLERIAQQILIETLRLGFEVGALQA